MFKLWIFLTVILAVIMKGSSLSSDKVDDSNLLKPNEHANKHNSTRHHKNHHHHHNDTRNHKKRHRQQFQQPNFNNILNNNNNNNQYQYNPNDQTRNQNQNRNIFKNKVVINIADHWEKIPYLLQTYNEPTPEQWHLMPHLSNGFLGTTAKNSSLYFNGLYNGYNGRSHRVRIPSLVAFDAEFGLNYDPNNNNIETYHFNCRRGVYSIETRNNDALMTQRFYVHRRLKNIIVTEIRVELLIPKSVPIYLYNNTELELNSSFINNPLNPNRYSYYNQKYDPEQMTYEQRVIKDPTQVSRHLFANDGIYYLKSTIPTTEINNNRRQKEVHTYYTNIPKILEVYPNTTVRIFNFIQSVDTDNSRARNAYDEALRLIQNDPNGLFVSHTAAWEEVWNKAGTAAIQETNFIDSNHEEFKLAQRLYVSFYNIYSAIPMSFDNQFYGVSPAGLAYGGLKSEYFNVTTSPTNTNRHVSEGYGGHVMYNQELFVLPLVSMFNNDMSKSIINSRLRRGYNIDSLNVYEQARENARQENLEGLRFAWEQGDYGVDVSQSQDAKKSKIHVSADVSFGLRSYLRMTHSNQFLMQSISNDVSINGENYLLELSKYWFDKFELDTSTNEYVIRRVSFGERPQSREVDNELYTNYLAALTMDTYKYGLELSSKNPYESQNANLIREYDERINRVKQPYEQFRKLYLEYDNFVSSQQNEETFVPFLNYPVQKYFEYAQKKAIYDNYAIQLPNESKNILTYASYVVGYSELREENKAKEYFNRMANHFIGPFNVLSESVQPAISFNPLNTYNYLPGYAAYAHAFIAGYCGVRVRDFQIDLIYPSDNFGQYQGQVSVSGQNSVFKEPSANTDLWNITGIAYRGNKLDIIYNLRTKSVEIRNRRANDPLVSGDESLEVAVYEGSDQVIKQLRLGDSVQISLTSELWYYNPKKSRVQNTYRQYSENINILASIYSSQYRKNVILPSSSNGFKFNTFLISFVLVFTFFLQ